MLTFDNGFGWSKTIFYLYQFIGKLDFKVRLAMIVSPSKKAIFT